MKDLDSRNYDIRDIEIDPRFKIAYKEMLLTLGVWFLFMVVSLVVAYTLGKGPVDQYTYVLGMPAWWFGAVVVSAIFAVIVIYISQFVFTDVELTDESTETLTTRNRNN
jgi:uncharacterized membrane protein YhdT